MLPLPTGYHGSLMESWPKVLKARSPLGVYLNPQEDEE